MNETEGEENVAEPALAENRRPAMLANQLRAAGMVGYLPRRASIGQRAGQRSMLKQATPVSEQHVRCRELRVLDTRLPQRGAGPHQCRWPDQIEDAVQFVDDPTSRVPVGMPRRK